MKKLYIGACILMAAFTACAWDIPEDYLTVDGESHLVRADPLWRYLSTACTFDRLEDYVGNFYSLHWPEIRRYWKVEDTHLYLTRIENGDQEEFPLEKLFFDYDGSPVRAVWFSGHISYRRGDSPVIQLNHEFYEEENVIRFVKGKEVERFVINHRERWLAYARNIMDQHRPLAGFSPDIPEASPDAEEPMTGFLDQAFAVITHPKEKPSQYCPAIAVAFNADLDAFEITEAHKKLTSYELLEAIARETQSSLNISISNRLVTYEIGPEP